MGIAKSGKIVYFDLSEGCLAEGISEGLSALFEAKKPSRRNAYLKKALALAEAAGISLSSKEKSGLSTALALAEGIGSAAFYRTGFPLPSGDSGEGVPALLKGKNLSGRPVRMDAAGVLAMLTLAEEGDCPPMVFEVSHGSAPGIFCGKDVYSENSEELLVLETNIDDLSPEITATLIGLSMEAGALDAWITPILMKKGRPAFLLSALVEEKKAAAVRAAIFRNSTAIGIREVRVGRKSLERRMERVKTPWGEVGMKVSFLAGEAVNSSPEFGDAERLSKETGVPVKEIMASALAENFKKGRRKKQP